MRETLRRRVLKARELIKFPTVTNYAYNPSVTSAIAITIANGNHFYYRGYRRGTAGTCYVNESTVQLGVPSNWPSFLDLYVGDVVVMKLKNVTVYSAQKSSYNGYAQITLRDASNTFICGWGSSDSTSPLYVVGQETKTYDELVTMKTITADTSVHILRFYEYGTAQAPQIRVTCDLEVYVNGERVI